MSLYLLQLATTIGWLLTSALLTPSFIRSFFGRTRDGDDFKTALFFTGLLFAGFSGRWLIAPTQYGVWKLLYALSLGVVLYIWLLLWNRRTR